MDELLDLGVDGLITDRTDVLKHVLIRRGQWRDHAMTTTHHGDRRPDAASTRRKEQRAWYWYDWANSAYVTTIATVLFAPYLITVAEQAAGCVDDDGLCDVHREPARPRTCPRVAALLRRHGFATIVSALRAARRRRARRPVPPQEVAHGRLRLGRRGFASLLFFVKGDNWQLGALLPFVRQQHASAALAGRLRRDPVSRSRPRTSATGSRRAAGRSATSAAACCWP